MGILYKNKTEKLQYQQWFDLGLTNHIDVVAHNNLTDSQFKKYLSLFKKAIIDNDVSFFERYHEHYCGLLGSLRNNQHGHKIQDDFITLACESNHLEILNYLLMQNFRESFISHAIEKTIELDRLNLFNHIVKLIKCDDKKTFQNYIDDSLFLAIDYNKPTYVHKSCEYGARTHYLSWDEQALERAAFIGNKEVFDIVLSYDEKLHRNNSEALFQAMTSKKDDYIVFFHILDLDRHFSKALYPVMFELWEESDDFKKRPEFYQDIMKRFLSYVDHDNHCLHQHLLLRAVSLNMKEVVEEILEHNFDFIHHYKINTALANAVDNQHIEIMKILFDYGANADEVDKYLLNSQNTKFKEVQDIIINYPRFGQLKKRLEIHLSDHHIQHESKKLKI